MATIEIQEKEAKHGEKMIEVKVRFWTNDIAEEEGKIVPKHAWSGGVVRMTRNESHGIKPNKPAPFHTLLDLPGVVEQVLIEHGIKLHPSDKMSKYITLTAKE